MELSSLYGKFPLRKKKHRRVSTTVLKFKDYGCWYETNIRITGIKMRQRNFICGMSGRIY